MRLPLVVDAYRLVVLATLRRRRFTALAVPAITQPADPPRGDDDERVIAAAQRAIRWAEYTTPGRLTCLQRTMALHRLLARRGVATRPQIGVRKQGGELQAHAWLEYQGRIVNSSVAHCRQYQALRPIPAADDRPQ
jgi:Transglutaminase-like superfamily